MSEAPSLIASLRHECAKSNRHDSDGCSCSVDEILMSKIATLQAEVERLTKENTALAAWQCIFTDGRTGLVCTEGGHQICAMQTRAEAAEARLAGEPVKQLGGAPDDLHNLAKVVFADMSTEQINSVCNQALAMRDPTLTLPAKQDGGAS